MKIDHSKPPNEKMIVNIRDVKSTFANLLGCVGIGVGIRSIFEVHVTDIVQVLLMAIISGTCSCCTLVASTALLLCHKSIYT